MLVGACRDLSGFHIRKYKLYGIQVYGGKKMTTISAFLNNSVIASA